MAVPVISYSSETWTMTDQHTVRIQTGDMNLLRLIARYQRIDKIQNKEIRGLGHKSWQLFYFVDICERITNVAYMCRVECLQAYCVCRTTDGSVIAGCSAARA